MKQPYNPKRLKYLIERQEEIQEAITQLTMKGAPIAYSWWPWHIWKYEKIVKELAKLRMEYAEVCTETKHQINQQSHYMRQQKKTKPSNNHQIKPAL